MQGGKFISKHYFFREWKELQGRNQALKYKTAEKPELHCTLSERGLEITLMQSLRIFLFACRTHAEGQQVHIVKELVPTVLG